MQSWAFLGLAAEEELGIFVALLSRALGLGGLNWGWVHSHFRIPVASGSLYRQVLRAEGRGAALLQTTHKVPSKSRSNKRSTPKPSATSQEINQATASILTCALQK